PWGFSCRSFCSSISSEDRPRARLPPILKLRPAAGPVIAATDRDRDALTRGSECPPPGGSHELQPPQFAVRVFRDRRVIAGASGQTGASTWPANARVSEDHYGNPQAETSIAADPND